MSWRNGVTMTLGIITIVVGLDTAVGKSEESSAHSVCDGRLKGKPHPLARTKDTRACPVCENDARNSFLSAVDSPEGLKLLTNEEKGDARADTETMKKKVALGLHDATEVNTKTMPSGSAYYLTPQGGADGYAVILDLLRRHPEKVLMCQWVPASRANQYQVKPYGDTLVMVETARVENVKVVQQSLEPVNPANAAMLDMFLDNLTTPYDPATYADQYLVRLRELLATKEVVAVEGSTAKKGKAVAPVIDLTAALAQMAEAAKKPATTKRKKSA